MNYILIIIYSEILKLTEKISLSEEAKIYILKDIQKIENNILKIYSYNNDDIFKSKLIEKLTIYQNVQFNQILKLNVIKNLEYNLKKLRQYIKLIGFILTLLLIYIF